jgi:hypothetical protein
MGVQDFRWKKGCGKCRGYILFLWKKKRKSSIGNTTFVHHRIISAVKRMVFVSERKSYIVLRGGWCNVNLFNVRTSSEEKSNELKNSL